MSPPGAQRVAVDAGALARDRRGLGRLARATLGALASTQEWALTLLAGERDGALVHAEFPAARLAPVRSAGVPGRYDVVWYPFNGMRFASASPALVTLADAFAFTEPHREPVARFREQQPIRRAARRAARIVTISRWSRDQIVGVLGVSPTRIAVVQPGAPAPFTCDLPSPAGDGAEVALPVPLGERRYALLVGAREPRKNARLALAACARALRGPHEVLVIAGELAPGDRALARRLEVPCGHLIPSDALLRTLYRHAAVVLVPSLAEGFGLVALEAMACGAPVLAAAAGALPETTAGGADLLDPTDVAAWARAIRRLFDDAAHAQALATRGRARIARLDPHAPARAMLALLRETAQRGIDRAARA